MSEPKRIPVIVAQGDSKF